MQSRRVRSSTTCVLAGLMGAAAMLTGCAYEGGVGYSLDQYTYVSTTWSPKTITIRDTRTAQDIWSMDVPVGQQLVIRFDDNASGDAYYPALMFWELQSDSTLYDPPSNKIMVPDMHARRVDWKERPAPEMPSAGSTVAPVVAPAGSEGQPVPPAPALDAPAEPAEPQASAPVWSDPIIK
jgi:hypothetical protein